LSLLEPSGTFAYFYLPAFDTATNTLWLAKNEANTNNLEIGTVKIGNNATKAFTTKFVMNNTKVRRLWVDSALKSLVMSVDSDTIRDWPDRDIITVALDSGKSKRYVNPIAVNMDFKGIWDTATHSMTGLLWDQWQTKTWAGHWDVLGGNVWKATGQLPDNWNPPGKNALQQDFDPWFLDGTKFFCWLEGNRSTNYTGSVKGVDISTAKVVLDSPLGWKKLRPRLVQLVSP